MEAPTFAELCFPMDVQLLHVDRDRVLAVERDEMDVQTVTVRRILRWIGPPR